MNLAPYIGKPFGVCAHGPDAFDCWGLVHTAARDLFGLHFPEAVYATTTPQAVAVAAELMLLRNGWQTHDTADAGRVMALVGYDGCVRHVALCLDTTRALHVAVRLRSCVMPVSKLAALYPVARFYAWAP